MLKTKLKNNFLVFALLACGTVSAQNAAIVNGQSVPSGLVDFIVNEQVKRGQPASDELRDAVRKELVNQELLKQEAVKKGLANSKDVKYQMQLMTQGILANALREDFFKNNKLTETEVNESYKKITETMGGDEYRASHILVENESEAKAIVAKLDKGGNFTEIASAQSKDPGSAKNGGDLDWANPKSFVPEFSQAMVALKKGEYTKTPVKSSFGYHVILLTDKRQATPPALADIRPQLEQHVLNEKWGQYLKGLTSQAKIK